MNEALQEIVDLLEDPNISFEDFFKQVVLCVQRNCCQSSHVRIVYRHMVIESPGFYEMAYSRSVDILLRNKILGKLSVYCDKKCDDVHIALLREVVERIKYFVLFKNYHLEENSLKKKGNWEAILEIISSTNSSLLLLIVKKMLYRLCLSGNKEAQELMRNFDKDLDEKGMESFGDSNVPLRRKNKDIVLNYKNKIFELASQCFPDREIFSLLEKWMHQSNARPLVETLESDNTTLAEVVDAITHYLKIKPRGVPLPENTKRQLIVSLIRRFLTDNLTYRKIAKNYFDLYDFEELLQRTIAPVGSHGRIGGKASGMFLAQKILKKVAEEYQIADKIKIPKTWFITSTGIDTVMHWNSMGDLIEQKYKSGERLRQEYPHIVQVFKSAVFPPEIEHGLSRALDDLHDGPLIVRSSSLLEDSFDASFAGKYKSLFLANQGTKQERLNALTDAILEIYASVFAPDPIIYRAERGLLDFSEAMGIMIQEVVGVRVDKYFFPPFAGVAFSNNEFRWSTRIKKDDGLVRLVPGLGTRAVDRLDNDYPILVSPGVPTLRANITADEMYRYSPQNCDVIDFERNELVTVRWRQLIDKLGFDYPCLKQTVSVLEGDQITRLQGLEFNSKDLVASCEGLLSDTDFLSTMRSILTILKEKMEFPVDVEFAYDGKNIYILQCRPQCRSKDYEPMPIPQNVERSKIVFTANRYISNGFIPDITHIVYVDPEEYGKLPDMESLTNVGRVVGNLNRILPKRKFILMGPGRWGSKGDIKLGVRVGYMDINETAALIEIAKKKGNYEPELSFGTHFFQDLVEANIRYLPLYPDDSGIIFNEKFFQESENLLKQLLPDSQYLEKVVKVIDVAKGSDGLVLRILMNSELDQALAYLTSDDLELPTAQTNVEAKLLEYKSDWNWRLFMAKHIAKKLEPQRFGVKDFYVFGSTKNNTATESSDINLIIHFQGDKKQRHELELWLEGWGLSLETINFLKTGLKKKGMLDVHIITDKEIKAKDPFAMKINAVTDPARKLAMKKS